MDVEKANLKLSVFDSFSYERLKDVCDAICDLGFTAEFIDNGNVVFTDKSVLCEVCGNRIINDTDLLITVCQNCRDKMDDTDTGGGM